MGFASQYLQEVRNGAEWLNAEVETPEEIQRQFESRREIVQTPVKRVDVLSDKSTKVYFEFDLLEGVENREPPT
jgi:hypothetical protein